MTRCFPSQAAALMLVTGNRFAYCQKAVGGAVHVAQYCLDDNTSGSELALNKGEPDYATSPVLCWKSKKIVSPSFEDFCMKKIYIIG